MKKLGNFHSCFNKELLFVMNRVSETTTYKDFQEACKDIKKLAEYYLKLSSEKEDKIKKRHDTWLYKTEKERCLEQKSYI